MTRPDAQVIVPGDSSIDKEHARQAFSRAARGYDAMAVLQREVGARMAERLDYVKLEPRRVLDAGCGTGAETGRLLGRYPKAHVLALDFAEPMLAHARRRGRWWRKPSCLCADLESLPLADASLDLVWSNLALQWLNDLPGAFAEVRRVLRPGGLFMFTSFGPDTLKELRAAWAAVDAASHVSPFLDMHDVGDLLMQARFADPVMDVEHLTLTYTDARQLMRELKGIGAHNATIDRPRGLTGKTRLRAMLAAYERFRCDGVLPASYEVVYGHAWVPHGAGSAPGEVRIGVDSIRRHRP
jgi:malonyl-CoA O-methyltransferase